MVAITKCNSSDCRLKEKCYRWTCPADEENQWYADFSSEMNGNGMGCRMILADPSHWKKLKQEIENERDNH